MKLLFKYAARLGCTVANSVQDSLVAMEASHRQSCPLGSETTHVVSVIIYHQISFGKIETFWALIDHFSFRCIAVTRTENSDWGDFNTNKLCV